MIGKAWKCEECEYETTKEGQLDKIGMDYRCPICHSVMEVTERDEY